MCEYCEPFESDGEEIVLHLPNPDADYGGVDMFVGEDVDGSRCIIAFMYPPIVAGPIEYCPMCGRKLVSE